MNHVAAVIQTRMGSTRFPGKALRPLAGIPMTEHIIKRVQQVAEFDRIILAIPAGPKDEPLSAIAKQMGVDCVKGPEDDVLQRFIMAGNSVRAKHIVRICGDNPLVDLSLPALLIRRHFLKNADYTIPSEPIPLGTGTEVVSLSTLKQIAGQTEASMYREHVTTFFHDHLESFKIERVPPPSYLRGKNFRLTVDTEKDYLLMDQLYNKFFNQPQTIVDLEQVVRHLEAQPDLARLNADVIQADWRKGNP